jgi:hypothetical protein
VLTQSCLARVLDLNNAEGHGVGQFLEPAPRMPECFLAPLDPGLFAFQPGGAESADRHPAFYEASKGSGLGARLPAGWKHSP